MRDCVKLRNKKQEKKTGKSRVTLRPPPTEFTVRAVDFEGVDTYGTSKRVYLSAIVNNKKGILHV